MSAEYRLAAVEAELNDTRAQLTDLTADLQNLYTLSANRALEQNDYTVLIMATMIFMMQCGFALLEAGSVRSKNITNILLKNFVDLCISSLCFWCVGWTLAFGEPSNALFGYGDWFSSHLFTEEYRVRRCSQVSCSVYWFVHNLFAANAVTIVSGALAERCHIVAYCLYCIPISVLIYPLVAHWVWAGNGWLVASFAGIQFTDFAGSGVVHLVGGTCAGIGAYVIGPRRGRWNDKGNASADLKGHSIPFAMLGAFLLMFGFFAFNGVTAVSLRGLRGGVVMSLIMAGTLLSCSTAALSSIIIEHLVFKRKWGLSTTMNAALAGMVAICAGGDEVDPWVAVLIGFLSTLTYMALSRLMVRLNIDDPLDATAVHAGGGLVGLLSVPIFSFDRGILYHIDDTTAYAYFAWQILGIVVIFAWSALIITPTFIVLNRFELLRVEESIEIKGLDMEIHGETAYPLTAYGHGWTGDLFTKEDTDWLNKVGHGLGIGHSTQLSRLQWKKIRARHASQEQSTNLSEISESGPEDSMDAVDMSVLQRQESKAALQRILRFDEDDFIRAEPIAFSGSEMETLDSYLRVNFDNVANGDDEREKK